MKGKTFIALLCLLAPVPGAVNAQESNRQLNYNENRLDSSLLYINAGAFIQEGLTGKGVKIGIIDMGFLSANTDSLLQHVFTKKRLLAMRDFVDPMDKDLFDKNTDLDWHGTTVWKTIAGYDQKSLFRYGLATDALFYIARTDRSDKEFAGEQEFFRSALEWMHKEGVRLINVSLGYSFGFDDPKENYVPEDMNGKTAIITRAVAEYVQKYNMIIVKSAGNEGRNMWKVVSAPADAEGVLAVGATDNALGKRNYSSEGPDFLPWLKPDISCFTFRGGTSFAAPVITGLVACMLEKKPTLSNKEITGLLQKSGHLYPYGNNYLGYGSPDAGRILKLMEDPDHDFRRSSQVRATGNEIEITVGNGYSDAMAFHKKDKWIVLKQEKLPVQNGKIIVGRPGVFDRYKLVVDDKAALKSHVETKQEKAVRTTVATPGAVIEIVWE